ncbi:MAG: hypothetical protein ABFD13_03460 [Candidatus Cryosericum sp.]
MMDSRLRGNDETPCRNDGTSYPPELETYKRWRPRKYGRRITEWEPGTLWVADRSFNEYHHFVDFKRVEDKEES